jgi:ATP phosphoribosyltransferase regulatory subunit
VTALRQADRRAVREEAARLLDRFVAHGAEVIETDVLVPAETLLDLYGEDIRGRAFVTPDPLRGEMVLRPDFTVPVVQAHMSGGATPARYAYAGKVFRRQEFDPDRPSEYVQVGFEVLGEDNRARADAEVFTLFADLLAPLGLRVATGDIGLLTAAVRGLATSERRRAALLRHLWRPRRFRRLLERFGAEARVPPARAALLAAADPFAAAGPEIGLRDRHDVEARLEVLRADAAEPPISAGETALLEEILSLRENATHILGHLRDMVVDMPGLSEAIDRFAARLEALSALGVDVDALDFEASYGRTALEYYDGFVFGFYAQDRPDLPPVATGGRYDALTAALGGGGGLPAVGGVVRPGLAWELGR